MLKIREFRLKKGLNQTELAKLLEFGQHAVSTWEKGTR